MTCKEGTFDWIVNFDKLVPIFTQFNVIKSPQEGSSHNDVLLPDIKVLVIGCGTSTLSESLLNYSSIEEIVSIDNDDDVIEYMRNKYQNEERLKWYTYDIVTGENKGDFNHEFLSDLHFDIIMDKGTVDAILVEGVIHQMLCDVRKLLKYNGIYFICSLFDVDVLYPILSCPILGYSVQHCQTRNESEIEENFMKGNIYICRKSIDVLDDDINVEALGNEEREVMNHYFQSKVPLLTKEREIIIYERFLEIIRGSKRMDDSHHPHSELNTECLTLRQAYEVLFGECTSLGYSFDLFLEDIANFSLHDECFMSYAEIIDFMKRMQ